MHDTPERDIARDMVRRALPVAPVWVLVCGLVWGVGGAASTWRLMIRVVAIFGGGVARGRNASDGSSRSSTSSIVGGGDGGGRRSAMRTPDDAGRAGIGIERRVAFGFSVAGVDGSVDPARGGGGVSAAGAGDGDGMRGGSGLVLGSCGGGGGGDAAPLVDGLRDGAEGIFITTESLRSAARFFLSRAKASSNSCRIVAMRCFAFCTRGSPGDLAEMVNAVAPAIGDRLPADASHSRLSSTVALRCRAGAATAAMRPPKGEPSLSLCQMRSLGS